MFDISCSATDSQLRKLPAAPRRSGRLESLDADFFDLAYSSTLLSPSLARERELV